MRTRQCTRLFSQSTSWNFLLKHTSKQSEDHQFSSPLIWTRDSIIRLHIGLNSFTRRQITYVALKPAESHMCPFVTKKATVGIKTESFISQWINEKQPRKMAGGEILDQEIWVRFFFFFLTYCLEMMQRHNFLVTFRKISHQSGAIRRWRTQTTFNCFYPLKNRKLFFFFLINHWKGRDGVRFPELMNGKLYKVWTKDNWASFSRFLKTSVRLFGWSPVVFYSNCWGMKEENKNQLIYY